MQVGAETIRGRQEELCSEERPLKGKGLPCAQTRRGLCGISGKSHSFFSSRTLPVVSGSSQGSVSHHPTPPSVHTGISSLGKDYTYQISRMSNLHFYSCKKTCYLTPCLLPRWLLLLVDIIQPGSRFWPLRATATLGQIQRLSTESPKRLSPLNQM